MEYKTNKMAITNISIAMKFKTTKINTKIVKQKERQNR